MVHPYGLDVESLWQACLNESTHFEEGLLFIPNELTQFCRQETKRFEKTTTNKEAIENDLMAWSLYSLRKLLNADQAPLGSRDGLIIATTTGLTRAWEKNLLDYLQSGKQEGVLYQPIGGFAQEICHQLGHTGPVQIISSACSAGTQAIGLGRNWIQAGFVDRCIILGAEQICDLTKTGFASLSLVNGKNCLPFNEDESGICLSEAVGALVLEKNEFHGEAVDVVGYGCASDGYSMTAPKPDGSGPMQSIASALKDAQLEVQDIDWVHAHGTGSRHNDRAEAAALKKLNIMAPVSSTKGIHGHSLAASGVLETILCIEAIKKRTILASSFAQPKHFTVNICDSIKKKNIDYVLKNSLGFGGVNASLILGRRVGG